MRVYAIREFKYDGVYKERGEVFELQGLRNDGVLLAEDCRRVNLIRTVPKTTKNSNMYLCDPCSKTFIEERFKYTHEEGRIHPRSPNFEGENARFEGEQPTPMVKELAVKPGKVARY